MAHSGTIMAGGAAHMVACAGCTFPSAAHPLLPAPPTACSFMLASGEVFGRDQPVSLQLLGSERSREALEGVAMELEDRCVCMCCWLQAVKGAACNDGLSRLFAHPYLLRLCHPHLPPPICTAPLTLRPPPTRSLYPLLREVKLGIDPHKVREAAERIGWQQGGGWAERRRAGQQPRVYAPHLGMGASRSAGNTGWMEQGPGAAWKARWPGWAGPSGRRRSRQPSAAACPDPLNYTTLTRTNSYTWSGLCGC